VSDKDSANARERVQRSKLNRKVLYHFSIFAIFIKILIKKDWRMSAHFARLNRGMYIRSRHASGECCTAAKKKKIFVAKLFVAVRHSPLARLEHTSYGLAARHLRSFANPF